MALINPGSTDALYDLVGLFADPKKLEAKMASFKAAEVKAAAEMVKAKKALKDLAAEQTKVDNQKAELLSEEKLLGLALTELKLQKEEFAKTQEAFNTSVLKYNDEVRKLEELQLGTLKSIDVLEAQRAEFKKAVDSERALIAAEYKEYDARVAILAEKETAFHEMKAEHLAAYAKIKSLL